ncbi:ribonuclease Z [Candidatus Bathyarchaeota archaeon]|nr:ribonuclease Z [Candidatus Bathyarchaeota archaeon]
MQVIFLGTSGGIPTARRSLPAIAIKRGGELILFDCGEGTQRQMILAKVGFCRKTRIFITHMHGDHVLGLPGLFQTMSLLDRTERLDIYGPTGIRNFVEAIRQTVRFTLTFPIAVHEIEEGIAYKNQEYEVYATWVDHSIPTLAYALVERERPGKFYPDKARKLGVPEGPLWAKLKQGEEIRLHNGRIIRPDEVVGPPRPGRKIAYSSDTKQTEAVVKLAEKADLLIHEATLDDKLKEKAEEEGHSTAGQAAETAAKAKAKRLFLFHISARYEDPSILLEQASKVFQHVQVAEDLMKVEVPYSE